MIGRQEILEFSREFSLRPNVVEKDYALGWLLFGIGQHPELKDTWVFKGGTCLKKCYFETYRFSEDLDFTLLEPAHLDEAFLKRVFSEASERIYQRSGLELPPETFRCDVFQNPRGKTAVQGRIGYRGPIAPGGELPRIKLDLTNDEQVVLKPIRRRVHHGYSDAPEEGIEVLCYPYLEIFAEKIRALAERQRPRDVYDVIHLYRHPEMRPDPRELSRVVGEKCSFKGIAFPSFQALQREPHMTELKTEWPNMLAHQLPALPPFEGYWSELAQLFAWLGGAAAPVLERIPAGREPEDPQWVPPAVAHAWGLRVPLEVIRFAGANRLCVKLGYDGTERLIEPYSLRRTQEGNLLLHAIRVEDRKHRSYRVDKIESAEVTQQSFTPAYAVELTPAGPLHAPPQTRSNSLPSLGRGITGFSPRRSAGGVAGPRYVVQCSLCGRRFTKTTMDTSLRPHKAKGGYPCSGSYGQYVETKWG